MFRALFFFIVLNCLALVCPAQDSISVNDAKVIKARSEITIERYLKNFLNTISYAGAESADIKDLISQSFKEGEKKLFLNEQVAVADDVSDPEYTNVSNAPEISAIRYLNAFNTFYGKSDSSSVQFGDVRSSRVKRGKKNMYINVYFNSFFKNSCLARPSVPYQRTARVAEIFVKKGTNNKWLLYISRIGFFTPADTVNDYLDDIVLTNTITSANAAGYGDEMVLHSVNKFNRYIEQARLEEKRKNYPAAIRLYTDAIALAPEKRAVYDARIKELNASFRILTALEEKYKAGDYKDAIKGYSELLRKPALNAGYSNSDYYLGRAKCYDRMGQLTKSYNEQVRYYQEAMDDYAKSYEYDNDNLETIRRRADLYRRLDRNVEALTEYRTYLAKDPTDTAVFEATTNLEMRNGTPDQAAPSSLNYELGNIYLKTGKYDSAQIYLNKAYNTNPSNGYILYSKASCFYLLGNMEESLKWYERSFKTNEIKRSFVDHDMLLGSLQENERFKDLKKKYL